MSVNVTIECKRAMEHKDIKFGLPLEGLLSPFISRFYTYFKELKFLLNTECANILQECIPSCYLVNEPLFQNFIID